MHGDVHEWNVLQADPGLKLIDPDGLLAEAEYGPDILLREDRVDLAAGPPARARWLAQRRLQYDTIHSSWGFLADEMDAIWGR